MGSPLGTETGLTQEGLLLGYGRGLPAAPRPRGPHSDPLLPNPASVPDHHVTERQKMQKEKSPPTPAPSLVSQVPGSGGPRCMVAARDPAGLCQPFRPPVKPHNDTLQWAHSRGPWLPFSVTWGGREHEYSPFECRLLGNYPGTCKPPAPTQ